MTGIITVPFHVGDFLSGTLHMDTLEKGAYLMLLLAHYQTGEQGLPNDDKKLSRIAGVQMKVWLRIKDVLAEKFDTSGSFWINKTCVDVLQKVHDKSSAQRAKVLKRKDRQPTTVEPQYNQPKPKPKPDKEEDKNYYSFKFSGEPFKGSVISLDAESFNLWFQRYSFGDEHKFREMIANRDDWFSTQPYKTQANWLNSTTKWLEDKKRNRGKNKNESFKKLGEFA